MESSRTLLLKAIRSCQLKTFEKVFLENRHTFKTNQKEEFGTVLNERLLIAENIYEVSMKRFFTKTAVSGSIFLLDQFEYLSATQGVYPMIGLVFCSGLLNLGGALIVDDEISNYQKMQEIIGNNK